MRTDVLDFSSIRTGDAQKFGDLVVVPLFRDQDRPGFEYLSMSRAFSEGTLEIGEISEGGSVPRLMAVNRAKKAVLLLDGEEVKGAKQNRIMNTSILLAPESETEIPVSCTEQGRWGYRSRAFEESRHMMSAKARMRKERRVKAGLKSGVSSFAGDQGEVWEDVQDLHFQLGTHSRTGAMEDAYRQKMSDLNTGRKNFRLMDGQTGILVFEHGSFKNLDLVSRPEVFADLFDKLIHSHLVEQFGRRQKEEKALDAAQIGKVLHHLGDLKEDVRVPSVGLGEDVRCEDEQFASNGLEHRSDLIHLHAFAKTDDLHRRRRSFDRGTRGNDTDDFTF